ncbi:MAG: diacylglycerol kinase family lipid kinase [Alphaproteobacteria bacterium]|nr:diacylglycerol kinase family lipid kinase [Alphaproteobacteria bacterium]MBL6937798.1 diacylglycerol kinase family lipid kinase [Alphaproteobacteria bacterium]MBL7099376.1 diacylglycerol kinase family lipid kinase [Alphaproteobacteria bacterium]
MSAFVVVNPRSGNGRTGREWKAISRRLASVYPQMSVGFTTGRGQAMSLVRGALREGFDEIVAVGGDGTINEAVNGMFVPDGPLEPDAVFAFVTSGTGGDFRKSFGIEAGWSAAIDRLKRATVRQIDVGRVQCLSGNGRPTMRHFINIASFGLSGMVIDSVNRASISKMFGGSFAFAFHSVSAMLRYKNTPVRIMVDNKDDEIATISVVAVANGQFFGGGMKVAPDAALDDGLFDVVVMGGAPAGQSLSKMNLIYTGDHIKEAHVRVVRGKHVVVAPVAETAGRPVLVETDGEFAGRLPASFEILPRALNLRC